MPSLSVCFCSHSQAWKGNAPRALLGEKPTGIRTDAALFHVSVLLSGRARSWCSFPLWEDCLGHRAPSEKRRGKLDCWWSSDISTAEFGCSWIRLNSVGMGCGVPSSAAVSGSGFWGLSLTRSSLSSAGADKKAEAGAGAATEFQFVSVSKLAFCFGGFE